MPPNGEKPVKIIATDPETQPISIPSPKNRNEALSSPSWPGYHTADKAEMKSHADNETWVFEQRSDVAKGAPILRDIWAHDDNSTLGDASI